MINLADIGLDNGLKISGFLVAAFGGLLGAISFFRTGTDRKRNRQRDEDQDIKRIVESVISKFSSSALDPDEIAARGLVRDFIDADILSLNSSPLILQTLERFETRTGVWPLRTQKVLFKVGGMAPSIKKWKKRQRDSLLKRIFQKLFSIHKFSITNVKKYIKNCKTYPEYFSTFFDNNGTSYYDDFEDIYFDPLDFFQIAKQQKPLKVGKRMYIQEAAVQGKIINRDTSWSGSDIELSLESRFDYLLNDNPKLKMAWKHCRVDQIPSEKLYEFFFVQYKNFDEATRNEVEKFIVRFLQSTDSSILLLRLLKCGIAELPDDYAIMLALKKIGETQGEFPFHSTTLAYISEVGPSRYFGVAKLMPTTTISGADFIEEEPVRKILEDRPH